MNHGHPFWWMLLAGVLSGCHPDNSTLLGHDIRLFQGGAAWSLAQAVQAEDTAAITARVRQERIAVDTREPRFGQTLLMWAVRTNRYAAAKTLLRHGADPNLPDTYTRTSALMRAADYGPGYDRRPALLALLLAHGGDPNAVEQGTKPDEPSYKPRQTPLLYAASCCLEKTKLLVAAGANVNFRNENGQTPLLAAVMGGREAPALVRYLLLERKADFRNSYGVTVAGDTVRFASFLRDWTFPLDSEAYRTKMEIAAYLKRHGEDYWKTDVPAQYRRHYSKAYLARY